MLEGKAWLDTLTAWLQFSKLFGPINTSSIRRLETKEGPLSITKNNVPSKPVAPPVVRGSATLTEKLSQKPTEQPPENEKETNGETPEPTKPIPKVAEEPVESSKPEHVEPKEEEVKPKQDDHIPEVKEEEKAPLKEENTPENKEAIILSPPASTPALEDFVEPVLETTEDVETVREVQFLMRSNCYETIN